MLRNPELDRLKSRQQSLFEQKQAAFRRFKDLQEQTNVARRTLQACWDERVHARECMNHEFEAMQSAYSCRDSVWGEYTQIRDRNNSKIESLKHEADIEHRAMQECFDDASSAYQYGDKSEAPYYSQQGYEHRDRRNALNAEISELAREIKQAKANAEALSPKTDSSGFNRAKSSFEQAKSRHESAQAEFNALKNQLYSVKDDFDHLQERFKQAQAEFNRKLEEVKSEQNSKKHQAIDKVNMALIKSNTHYLGTIFGQDAKVVPKKDGSGKIDVYFGGLNAAGDEIGHGHATIDANGNVTYLRDAWATDKHDYLIDENADKKYGAGTETHRF